MIKQLRYIPTLLLSSVIACSNHHRSGIQSGIKEQTQLTQVKNPMRHHRVPDGVISVDIINHNDRLHLLTGKHHQGNKTLWYQYSDDYGKNWSVATKVLNKNDLPAKIVRGNDARIAAQGNTIVVAWMKYDEDARFNAGPMQTARSIDGGQTWKYAAIPPDWPTGPHGYIDLAADENAMHAVWLDSRNGVSNVKAAQGLRYARSIDGGLSWQANKTIDELTCSCCWNTLKTVADGHVVVLYRDKQPSDMRVAVIDQQQHWQQLSNVGQFNWNFDGCPHIGGGLDSQQFAGHERLHAVVGSGQQDHLGVYSLYSDDGGHSWSQHHRLGDESALHADIAAHDNGRVVAVWDMMSENGLAVFVAESADYGNTWSQFRQLSRSEMRATHPRIVKTGKGFLALWTESDGQRQSLAMQRL